LSRDGADYCGNQIDLHEIDPRSDGFPAVTHRRPPRPSLQAFDREARTNPVTSWGVAPG
jgi:hypothetical protein